MDGDPYAAMVALIREQGAESGESTPLNARMWLGRVVNIAPLTVRVAGKDMPPSVLRINERLARGAKWRAKITSSDTVLDETMTEQLALDLESGDEVLLLTQDDQIFYIIMKVARAV